MIENSNSSIWHWQSGFLVCELLSPWKHGFFTRIHAPQLPDRLQSHLGTETAYRLKQVHGDRLICPQEPILEVALPEADGLYLNPFSSIKARSIWVCSADCVPILVGDRQLGTVAAIHAGWRGTAAQILPKLIVQLHSQGSNLKDLVVCLGPAISGEAYQVSEEVADRVLETISLKVGIINDPKPNHLRLDIRLVQQQQLLELGFLASQIAIAPYCTLNNPDLFFSYRRQTLASKLGTSKSETNKLEPVKSAGTEIQWSGISAKFCGEYNG
jgi:polyphenol oxidase